MIVMKFGGSSLGDASLIELALRSVARQRERKPLIVLSAMGKTTNRLLEIAQAASRGERDIALSRASELCDYHLQIAGELLTGDRLQQAARQLDRHVQRITEITQGLSLLGECTPRSKDAIASLGERMSTLIFSHLLRERGYAAELLDSGELIHTDDRFTSASVLEDPSWITLNEKIPPLLAAGQIPVLQGFIGSTLDGIPTTIGRGGSDYTAAFVGAALGAEDIQIWTDVPGILTADPRVVTSAYRIRAISFNEASELAYFGAKVLFPASLFPAIKKNIPVHVCSTQRIDDPGTLISAGSVRSTTPVKSIAHKTGITVVNVHSMRMLMAHGFLRRIFETFDRFGTVVDVVSTSEVNVSLSIDSVENITAIRSELELIGETKVEPNMAIVCVVGDNVKYTPGVAARTFQALGDINVQMISQGASRINITFIVERDHVENAVRRLHEEFFGAPDPELFERI